MSATPDHFVTPIGLSDNFIPPASECVYQPHSIFTLNGLNLDNCDGSIAVLKSIFGQPIDYLLGNTTAQGSEPVHSLITLFIGHFNTAMVALIMVVYSYVVVAGVINTQTEGKFGGRLMGSMWFPIRLLIPPAMLLPFKGGFCALQFLIMYTVLVGVNIANQVWHYSVTDIDLGYVPTTPQALTTGIANDVGDIFVYAAVQQIINANGITATIPVNGSSGPVQGSPYQSQVRKKLEAACAGEAQPTVCMRAVDTLFNHNMAATVYPTAPGPNVGADFDKNLGYSQYEVGYGSKAGDYDGKYLASGFYTFSVDKALASPTQTGPKHSIDTQDIVALLKKDGKLANVVQDSGAAAENPCAAGSECSFSGLIGTVMDGMILANPQKLKPNQIEVQGTGQTCQNVCRVNADSNMPVPKWNGDPSTCTGSGMHMQHDNQCYKVEGGNAIPIPAEYLGNSWWYGSRVYLQLNQQMGENLTQLAKDIKYFQIDPQNVLKMAQFKPNGSNLTGLVTYADLKRIDYASNGTDPVKGTTLIGPGMASNGEISLAAQSGAPNANFAWPSWSDMICSYQPALASGMTASNCTQQLQFNKSARMPGSIVTFGGSAADSVGLKLVTTKNDPAFYRLLQGIPSQYQPPIGVLIKLEKAGKLSYAQLKSYVTNMVAVLKFNHIYPGSQLAPTGTGVSDQAEVNPVNYWISSIFNHLLGVNVPGIGGNVQTHGLFKDIYSLGNTNMSSVSAIISGSFNTLAQAQRIGLEMIDTVTLSLQTVYKRFDRKLASFRKTDRDIALGGGSGALGGELLLGGMGVPYSGSISTAIAVATQTALQFTLADQMHEIAEDLMWLPLLAVVITSLFTAGISFAVLLPLVPYILFWAGQIAWLLAVIEAMIAAPVVVLGAMTPGGHEHFGHIVPGFKMWISLVFRPVLMVLGLLVGLVLTFIVVRFSSQGFQLISNQIITFAGVTDNYGVVSSSQQAYANNVSLTQGIISCILLTTFCAFMVLAFNKCFSCIYVIPEKVMQWVGGAADKAGEQELQQMTSSVNQTAGQAAQGGNQAAEKGIGAESQYTQQEGSADGQGLSGGVQVAHQITRESQGRQGAGSGKESGGTAGN